MMNNTQKEVLRNIIYAVESGGQVYGNNNYDEFIGAYYATDKETAITIGAGQWMGVEAKTLLNNIRKADPSGFKKLDTAGIGTDLDTKNWSTYNVSMNSDKAACIKKIITSTAGKKCQDELIIQQMETYMAAAAKLGVTSMRALAMCANFTHQGGYDATKRVLSKTKKPYTLDNIYAACKTDTGNQVGAYTKRQAFVYKYLKEKFPETVTETTTNNTTTNNGGTHMISNCGHDENGRYSGGKAGDQTGTEWAVIPYYVRPWDCVLRHPKATVQNKIAYMAKAAALNNLIGYDQNERTTFWYHLKASNYDPAQITIACEADCSSGVAAIVKATGCVLGDDEMASVSIDCWTGNLKSVLRGVGFQVLTGDKYTKSADYLLPGDILLNEAHHVAINLDKGSKVSASGGATNNSGNTNSGSTVNTTVKWSGTTTKAVVPRTWAGEEYGSLKSVRSIPKNATVGVCDTIKDKNKKDWYFVLINNKVRGFIPADVVKKAGTTSTSGKLNTTVKWKGEVTASVLEVRTWAGTDYPNIKSWPQLSKGNRIGVCDESVKDSKGNAWYYVKIANKYYGFVHSAYVKKV